MKSTAATIRTVVVVSMSHLPMFIDQPSPAQTPANCNLRETRDRIEVRSCGPLPERAAFSSPRGFAKTLEDQVLVDSFVLIS